MHTSLYLTFSGSIYPSAFTADSGYPSLHRHLASRCRFLLANLMYCDRICIYMLPRLLAFCFRLARTLSSRGCVWPLVPEYEKSSSILLSSSIVSTDSTTILGSIMLVSAGDSWVALSSTVRNPVLACMVATLQVSRDRRASDNSRRDNTARVRWRTWSR